MIYVIQAGKNGPVKVGVAVAPKARLRDFQCGHYEKLSLVAVYPGYRDRERAIHVALAPWHIRGEWYDAEALPYLPDLLGATVRYERENGDRARLVLTRPTENDPTEWCPFCGRRHHHGLGDGHRIPHCGDDVPFPEVAAPDGTILRQCDGYIILTGAA